jgi:hypothetical protein
MYKKLKPFSFVLLGLMGIAALSGVLVPALYKDNLLVKSGWIGNDLVTLFLVLPVLVLSISLLRRGSLKGLLVWGGVALYALYCYAFYLFGAAFNSLFLVYVAILIAASFGLIQLLTLPEIKKIISTVALPQKTRYLAGLMIFISLSLGAYWIAMTVQYFWTGNPPALVTAVDHPTNVTGALDLWMVVSVGLLAGFWLWQQKPWGYVVGTIWSIKGGLYMTALSAAAIAQYISGAVADLFQVAIWAPIGLLSFFIAWRLLIIYTSVEAIQP